MTKKTTKNKQKNKADLYFNKINSLSARVKQKVSIIVPYEKTIT